MGDNKISEAVAWTVVGPDGETSIGGWLGMHTYEASLKWATLRDGHRYEFAYRQGEAVPVGYVDLANLRAGLPSEECFYIAWQDDDTIPVYLRPQPAELGDVFNEALAVGDGTVDGAVVYWHQRALAAEAKLSEVGGDCGELGALRKALALAVQQNSHDMLMTGEEIRQCEAALAATGKQQVGEVRGDRTPADYAIEHAGYMAKNAQRFLDAVNAHGELLVRLDDGDDVSDEELQDARESESEAAQGLRSGIYEFEKRRDRALASRQPVGQEPVGHRMVTGDPKRKWQWQQGAPSIGILRQAAENGWEVQCAYAAPPAHGIDLGPLRRLYQAYVRLLETGRDRIMDLGGTCDPVDAMERMDVDLIEARNLLGIKIDGRDAGTGVGDA